MRSRKFLDTKTLWDSPTDPCGKLSTKAILLSSSCDIRKADRLIEDVGQGKLRKKTTEDKTFMHKSDLAAILDSLKAPILFADTNHVTRYVNEAAKRHYTDGDDLVGKSLFECHNQESKKVMEEILELMLTENLVEREISQEDGQRIFMRVIKDSDGTVLGYFERYEPILEG